MKTAADTQVELVSTVTAAVNTLFSKAIDAWEKVEMAKLEKLDGEQIVLREKNQIDASIVMSERFERIGDRIVDAFGKAELNTHSDLKAVV